MTDLSKFPLSASTSTKLPLHNSQSGDDDSQYLSRIQSFLSTATVGNLKNYAMTAFKNSGTNVLQAGELNEIHERQLTTSTLNNQMWSNWTNAIAESTLEDGTIISPLVNCGPGWNGVTPLYPRDYDRNASKLKGGVDFIENNEYAQVEAAILFDRKIDQVSNFEYVEAKLKLMFNRGWYLVTDSTFINPRKWDQPLSHLYYRLNSASGLKHWVYLNSPVMFDVIVSGANQYNPDTTTFFPYVQVVDFGTGILVLAQDELQSLSTSNYTAPGAVETFKQSISANYFGFNLMEKSFCEHLTDTHGDCNENDGNSTANDTSPIKSTKDVSDVLFENPVNSDESEDFFAHRKELKLVPSYKNTNYYPVDPLNNVPDTVTNDPGTSLARVTNLLAGNQFDYDTVPSFSSFCVYCDRKSDSAISALGNMLQYVVDNTDESNLTKLESFDMDEFLQRKDAYFAAYKEGLKPRFINNMPVKLTVYDKEVTGQQDLAEQQWNLHFVNVPTDTIVMNSLNSNRNIQPI